METDVPSPLPYRKVLRKLASPAILFYTLPWLMVLLTIGTISQKYLGLYAAQNLFFSGWLVWLGPVPLPGTYLTLGIITLCLLAKFLLYSPWKKNQAGTILSHLGVLILLLGGILTAATQKEGYMMIGEGQTSSSISDYHHRVINIQKNGETIGSLDFVDLQKQHSLTSSFQIPFKTEIVSTCANCQPEGTPRENGHGLAARISLSSLPSEKEQEANLSGLMFEVSGAGADQNGTYLMMEEIPHKPAITVNGETYVFSIERRQSPLPFSITLRDFTRTLHPGTDMAKAFSSDIMIVDGNSEWPYTIRMNEPLRYRGYTFYQSSFSLRPDGEYTILSVVRNQGRALPYLASAVIFAGLLLHLFLRLGKRGARP